MTLENLKQALILNDKALLSRLESFLHVHSNLNILNGFGVNEKGKLMFNKDVIGSDGTGGSGNEEVIITDEQIGNMVDEVIASLNDIRLNAIMQPVVYGYKKSITNAYPETRIEYLEDCADFEPAYMDYAKGEFNYGSWKDAFFLQLRPVMLNFDGTVAYELDPNDYSKKKDGTPSDIENETFNGNAMIGIPTVWFKRETKGDEEYVYVSNIQADSSYRAYAHMSNTSTGDLMRYTYIPIYNGFIDASGRLRSLSNKTVNSVSKTIFALHDAVNLCNPLNTHMWEIETKADAEMLIDLLTLMGKTTDTAKVFGYGNSSGFKTNTGSMNDKGLFYGFNDYSHGVKVFGVEHFWGHLRHFLAGSIWYPYQKQLYVKMTYSTHDNTNVVGYFNSDNTFTVLSYYQKRTLPFITSSLSGYISKTRVDQFGRYINAVPNGTENTYECDFIQFANSNVSSYYNPETRGGIYNNELSKNGAYRTSFYLSHTSTDVYTMASPSCKPNIKENFLAYNTY